MSSAKKDTLVQRIKNGYVPDKSNKLEWYTYMYLQEADVSVDAVGSELVDFLRNKTILLTGGTGFLGKLLLEKLLRSCEDLDRIYLLVRPKRGVDFDQRIDKILDDEVFSKLRPELRKKVVGIKGDLTSPGLGLSTDDRRLLAETVQVVYHSAATTKFDEHIRRAVAINVKGTERMMKLARECERLESFVHISTAYSNCWTSTIAEQFYEPLMPAEKIYDVVEGNSDEQLSEMTPRLIGVMPNTYTFTKQIGEDVVRRLGASLPVCVVRPSIVTSTCREPIKGWIDNFAGPLGAMVAAAVGILHVVMMDVTKKADFVPADYTANLCIAASCLVSKKSDRNIPIYNFASGERNTLTWGKFLNYMKTDGSSLYTVRGVWYPFQIPVNNEIAFQSLCFAFHTLPAVVVDGILAMLGKKTMLLKAYKKIRKYFSAVAFFSTNDWTIKDENVRKLFESLSKKDKRQFNFDIADVEWREYFMFSSFGARIYLVKDRLDTLEVGWRRLRISTIMHYGLCFVLVAVILICLYLFVVFIVNYVF